MIDGITIFNLHDQDGVSITAKLRDSWIHVSSRLSNFEKSDGLQESYIKLLRAAQEESGHDQILQSRSSAQDTSDFQSTTTTRSASSTNQDSDNAETAQEQLLHWLLRPLASASTAQSVPTSSEKLQTLTEWYLSDINAYEVKVSTENQQIAKREKSFDGAKYIRQNIIPEMSLPKYLRKLSGVRWYSPSDLRVLKTSHDIHHPIHPTIVQVSSAPRHGLSHNKAENSEFFLKLATRDAYKAVTRELRIIHYLQRKGLINDSPNGIRAPKLQGLVAPPASPNSRSKIIGFLLRLIPQPAKPLIEAISGSIDESMREYWAEESQRMINVLHKNDIIWGDAKADNFMVDKGNELWMIDYGGSFTEGWVDPELVETKDGDNMAKSKIAEAVKEPGSDTNLAQPDSCTIEKNPSATSKKRDRAYSGEQNEARPSKRRNQEQEKRRTEKT